MKFSIALFSTLGAAQLLAVQTVTSVATSLVDVTAINTTRTFAGGNATYSGVETRIDTLTTASSTYVPIPIAAAATTRRSGAANNNTTIWNHNNLGAGGTGARTVEGAYSSSMETVFSNNNLRSGTENLFVNSSANVNDSLNNVERMDFVFASAFNPTADLAFSVFERGLGGTAGGANGGFRIAAITGVDTATGLHTYAPTIVVIAAGSYSNGGAGIGLASRYDVYTGTVGNDLNTRFNDNIGPQGLAGVLVGLNEFGTTSQIFGYSILPSDVTASAANIRDWTNTTYFSTNSGTVNDVDLVASGAQIYQVVPEPSALALLGFGGLALLKRKRSV